MDTPQLALKVPLFSIRFVRHYAVTMRPYLLFVSGITGIVGIAFSPTLSPGRLILVIAASFLSYGFGQALTDCFQIDTDSLSSPYRPLTRGIISRNQVMSVSLLGLVCCVIVFAYWNISNLFLGALAGLGLATYTPFKRRWWGGPFYNAWIVGVLCTMSFIAGGGEFTAIAHSPFCFVILAVFFGYANFVLSGYFKDIEADRPTGYLTLPAVYGRLIASVVSDLFAVLCVASLFFALVSSNNDFRMLSIVGGFLFSGVAATILGQVRLHCVRSDEEAHKAIAPVVHSYILLLSGMASFHRPGWGIPLVAFYGLYVLVMSIRPARNQI